MPTQQAGASTWAARGLHRWAHRRSLWVLLAGTSCCRMVGLGLGSPPFDFSSWGMRFCALPEEADVLLVMGPISLKMISTLRLLHARMSPPRRVIAGGVCACSGGGGDTYAAVQGLDRCIPVDIHVPGCPPTPETLLEALDALRRERWR